jgi:hypothetical protein
MDSWVDSSMVAAEPGCVLYGAAGCIKGQPNGMLITHAGAAAAVLRLCPEVDSKAATQKPEALLPEQSQQVALQKSMQLIDGRTAVI